MENNTAKFFFQMIITSSDQGVEGGDAVSDEAFRLGVGSSPPSRPLFFGGVG